MKILRGTVFGGITYFFLGWLAWGILLMDFMSANMNQCAARPDVMIWWAMIVSTLAAALLLTLILNWAKAKSVINGLMYGALFGLLYSSIVDLSSWSMTTMFNNFGVVIADILVATAAFAIVGLVIVLTWGRDK